MREKLIRLGIFFFPMPTKQCSISFAHSEEDVIATLKATEQALLELVPSLSSAGLRTS